MLVEKLAEKGRLENERLIKNEGRSLATWQKEIIGVDNARIEALMIKFAKERKLTGAETDILIEFLDFYKERK